MGYYLKRGNRIDVYASDSIDIGQKLEAKVYAVNEDLHGIYLSTIPDMDVPSKLYGSINADCDRIINTYNDRSRSTGSLLLGEKGSGKTLLAKLISNKMLANNVPVLIIKSKIEGDLGSFLSSISQEIVVFFDEFEKIYNEDSQQELLSIFDGVFSKKRLYLLTANEAWKISGLFKNRPGRVFYIKEYEGLEKQFILDYVNENLVNKELINEIMMSINGHRINFDMISAIVEEANRYGDKELKYVFNMLNTNAIETKNFSVYIKYISIENIRDNWFHLGNSNTSDKEIAILLDNTYYSRNRHVIEKINTYIKNEFLIPEGCKNINDDDYDYDNEDDEADKKKKKGLGFTKQDVESALKVNKFFERKVNISKATRVDSDGGLVFELEDVHLKLLPQGSEVDY